MEIKFDQAFVIVYLISENNRNVTGGLFLDRASAESRCAAMNGLQSSLNFEVMTLDQYMKGW